MGETAWLIASSYAAVSIVGAAIAVAVWRSTRGGGTADPARLAERERSWFVVVVALLAALFLGTIFFIPYGREAGASGQVVEVTALQFAWRIEPNEVKARTPVEFRLRATDVNHAFGVYDDRERLVLQVQVMPERTQKAVHTFERPGTYSVLCLEFCGLGHHVMETTFEVTP